MNLAHLQTFFHVAQLGSFSAAAEKLQASKGMVSRHVCNLEDALQCKLFNRTTRSVTLTEAGKELLDKATQIESIANTAKQNIHDLTQETTGQLKFTAPGELGRILCNSVIPDFISQHPQVNLTLNFSRQIKDIEFGEFDIALRANDKVPDNLVARDLGYVTNILVASPEWAETNVLSKPQDLQFVACIQDSCHSHWNKWQLQHENGQRIVIQTNSNIACSDYTDTKLLAKMGLGIANIPRYVVEDDLQNGKLIQLLPQWYSQIHSVHLIYAKQRHYPKKIQGFIRQVLAWRAENPSWFMNKSMKDFSL